MLAHIGKLFFSSILAVAFANAQSDTQLRVSVLDQANRPIPGVAIQIHQGDSVDTAITDDAGHAEFAHLKSGRHQVTASKDGFTTADIVANGTSVDLTLLPAAQKESVDVHDTVSAVEQGSSPPIEIQPKIARELPNRPATVADALPLVPGVTRSPGGGLQISASGENRSALIVNSADVTDPATGQFGLTVPIDSVQTLNVYQTPFLAEFGKFTAGLVSVETRRGGEKWKWELNDPFPEFRIRSYDLRGLRAATPRLNAEGPIVPGKLYFSEGFEYEIRKTEVFTLPFPRNQKKQEGVNSFAQLDWVKSGKHLITATMHVAPQRLDFVNLNYFNPESTTPDASTHNYTSTLADRYTIGGGLLENTFSITRFDARVWPQGSQDLSIAPGGNTGNYFSQQSREATRAGLLSTYSLAPISLEGNHNLKFGTYVAGSVETGQVTEHPIDIYNGSNQLLERISFTGGQAFKSSDAEFALFAQDHWIVTPNLALDLGVRAESQQITKTLRLAPRGGFAWTPFAHTGTTIRGGVGLFYDHVPLNVFAFENYPSQVITMFDSNGQVSSGPFTYLSDLGQVSAKPHLVFEKAIDGNFSPRSLNWNLQVEQPVTPFLKLRAGYLQNASSGLVVLNQVAPDPITNTGLNLLTGNGYSRYRQFELTAKLRVQERGQLMFSYVRSRARGDLNDFSTYLGSFPSPIVRPNQTSYLPTDLPNRFIAWGSLQLPRKFRISPSMEYRNGFPYAVTDASQNYVGIPYAERYPAFLSIDARVSKDFRINPKYAVRFSVTGYNLSDHFNPEALHSNTGDPAYGSYFGQRGRRFTADFDVIF